MSQTVQQLRIYTVSSALKDAFYARFHDHALRIMPCYGFEMVQMWESTGDIRLPEAEKTDNTFEFVYLLNWPDESTLHRQWAAFLADEEWTAIKQEVRARVGGEPVQAVEDRILVVQTPDQRDTTHP